jgi:hypothetical protein
MRPRWQDDLVRIEELERRVRDLEDAGRPPDGRGGNDGCFMVVAITMWLMSGYGLYKMLGY